MSGSKYSTANIFLPQLLKVRVHLERNNTNLDPFLYQMAKPMQSKFDKYWADAGEIHCIASVLDPRYKMSFLTHLYKKKMNLSCIVAEEKLISIKSRLEYYCF